MPSSPENPPAPPVACSGAVNEWPERARMTTEMRSRPPSRNFVLAYSALDAALAALDPDIRADLRAWQIEYQTLPPEVYPNTAAIAHLLPALDDPGNFAAAVDLMIDAIRARAQANSG